MERKSDRETVRGIVRHRARVLILVILLWSIYIVPIARAQGNLVEFGFTGTVTAVEGSPFGLNPTLGTTVNGTLTWDLAQPPIPDGDAPLNNHRDTYVQPFPTGMSVEIGGITIRNTTESNPLPQSTSITVFNNNNSIYSDETGYLLPEDRNCCSLMDMVGGIFKKLTDNGAPVLGSLAFTLVGSNLDVFPILICLLPFMPILLQSELGELFDGTIGESVYFTIDSIINQPPSTPPPGPAPCPPISMLPVSSILSPECQELLVGGTVELGQLLHVSV